MSDTVYHYKSHLRDIFFNLFELHRIQDTTLGKGRFADLDEESMRDALQALEQLASKELAESFASADREGLRIDGEGNVTLPCSLRRSLDAFYEGEWHGLDVPEHLGGMGAPPSVGWSAVEMISGANPSISFYAFGSTLSRVLDAVGTDEQRQRFAIPMMEKKWGGTMVLTEPDAGSDVGAGRTKARQVDGDLWELEGVKRFITNGDFDGPENIIHLVLARPEGAGPGTKGLSMFIVPKYWVNEDGSLGERNGVYCQNIERKMGLHASATCEMVFGGDVPARGLLVGGNHDGIRQMFQVIEQARMAIGIKSMSTLSTAYFNALAYAKERVQGPDLLKAQDKTSPRVRIIEHPDVRRMLMMQKVYAEGMRALCMYASWMQDQVELAGGFQSKEARPLHKRNDLLLPLVKGYCSEKAYELLSLSLQCYGGSGYLQDYPVEQYIRDQKIDTLYEGTTAIQALDLFFRKIARDGGETLQDLLAEIRATANNDTHAEALAGEREALKRALGDIEGIFGAMMQKVGESLYHVGLQGNRILFALAELVIGWLLIKQAEVALSQLPSTNETDRVFYESKCATARFFCRETLPQLTLTRKLIEKGNLDLMEMPEELFG